MKYFNNNAFILGALMFVCIFLSNMFYCLLCWLYKIKIVEFSIFFNPWFSIHKETIMGTKFSLGWLPLGGFIKPLGMDENEEEKIKFSKDDLPFAFFTKPNYLRAVFSIVPLFIYFLVFIISLILFSGVNAMAADFRIILEYIIKAFETMFNFINRDIFISSTMNIVETKNIVLFAFILLMLIYISLTPITHIMNWFSHEKKVKYKIQKVVGFCFTVSFIWLLVWKIPMFVFSFFSFSQNLLYVLSFFAGLFSVGLVCYFSTLFVVKNISQKINKYKNLK